MNEPKETLSSMAVYAGLPILALVLIGDLIMDTYYKPEPVRAEPVLVVSKLHKPIPVWKVIKYSDDGCFDYMIDDWRSRSCYGSFKEANNAMERMVVWTNKQNYMKTRTDFKEVTK